jgi:hypothetical protein
LVKGEVVVPEVFFEHPHKSNKQAKAGTQKEQHHFFKCISKVS